MQKLFLASLFKDVAHLLADFAGGGLAGKRVTFIPTAAIPDRLGFHVWYTKKVLERLGLTVDELELSRAAGPEIAEKLRRSDCIYINGGNTFFLLQEINRTGAGPMIKEQVGQGKLLIGESAGAIVLAPSIAYSQEMDRPEAAPLLEGCDALNLIDFYPVPHYKNFPLKRAAGRIIAQYQNELPLVPFSNGQAILVRGTEMELVPA